MGVVEARETVFCVHYYPDPVVIPMFAWAGKYELYEFYSICPK